MNRRDALAASVGILATATGLPQPVHSSDEKACVGAANLQGPIKDANEGDRCPWQVAFAHGTYTTYMAKFYHATGCTGGTSFDGPNGLALGCPGDGCASVIDKKIQCHPDLIGKGLEGRKDDCDCIPIEGDIARLVGAPKFIVFEAVTPTKKKEKIRAMIFKGEIFPADVAPFHCRVGSECGKPSGSEPVITENIIADVHCFMVPVIERGGDVCYYRITINSRISS